jgi:RHS repeat-associated protein
MKTRTALKTDLFADEHHRRKIDKLGDPLTEIEAHINFAALAVTYDEQNRKTGETVTYPDGHSQSYGYAYNLASKKTRLTWADGTEINYGYSDHGELKSMTIPNEGTIQINEYGWIAPKKITLPGGTTQTKGYDGLLNLETFKVQSSAEILNLANTYGKQQELTKRSRTDTANSSSNSKTESFSYDDELRLTKVETEGWLLNDKEIFTLDAVGNRTEHNKSQNSWAYDENNRLIKIGEGNCGSANTICYDYDEAGNTTKRTEGNRQTNYHYDTNNRLIEVSSSMNGTEQLIARYGYDPMNRRLWKEQYGNKDGQAVQAKRTYFLYSDEGLIGEETQNITLNVDGGVTTNGQPELTTQYGPRPDSEFTTGIMFVKTKNTSGEDTIAYYHHDHLDTPVQATDKEGNIVWSAIYNAFGRVTITTPAATVDKPTITSNLRLPGQYEDIETGLYYNWNRFYSPDEGRYVTSDPIGLMGGINQYAYVLGNPMYYIDPVGLKPGELFKNCDDAAWDMFEFIQEHPIFVNGKKYEYAGNLIMVGKCCTYDGQFYTSDLPGRIHNPPEPPQKTIPGYAGSLHTHPGVQRGLGLDFSRPDENTRLPSKPNGDGGDLSLYNQRFWGKQYMGTLHPATPKPQPRIIKNNGVGDNGSHNVPRKEKPEMCSCDDKMPKIYDPPVIIFNEKRR